ncbi:MAG: cysteine desulfurase [Chitinophagaceae bacterium]|nr:cysteine desulfurase [Chitinophagaceae bacterium]
MITTAVKDKTFDVAEIREQFPILHRLVKGKPLVYFDNAATSQKPQVVIDKLVEYYSGFNANIHRGIHTLAEEATAAFEEARDTAQRFLGAAHREEIIFTKGTTEGINLVASTWGRQNISAGDEIIISAMEHHSNIVPWQILCLEKGATLKVIPIDDNGDIILEEFKKLFTSKTKFVSVVHVSNSLGTVNPVKEIIRIAHDFGVLVLVDGAQSTVHLDIDVVALDCDFFVCSSHKIYGPTGTGVLYGKRSLLEAMPVFQGGGEMIKEVTFASTSYNDLPYKYEAGTPNIADTIAFKTALDFVASVGKKNVRTHENDLLAYATARLEEIAGLRIIGKGKDKISVVSFVIDKVHPSDIGTLLDNRGIAVRTGNHCTQPLMDRLCVPGTIRASFAMYNTRDEIDVFTTALEKSITLLS